MNNRDFLAICDLGTLKHDFSSCSRRKLITACETPLDSESEALSSPDRSHRPQVSIEIRDGASLNARQGKVLVRATTAFDSFHHPVAMRVIVVAETSF